jgi:putative SOS response-associated peptidase YedK
MCGRFTQLSDRDELARLFGLDSADVPELAPRYNVAPAQPVVAVRLAEDARPVVSLLRWGLIPAWAREPAIGHSLINARSETVGERPAFRGAFRSRRCLIPAGGFYEWSATGGKHKQPFHFRRRDGQPFAFAGLWERWQGGDGEPVETCAVLTTAANEVVRPVHERMPVILAPADFGPWLDLRAPADQLHALFRPYPAEVMEAVALGRYVSNPRNEGPQCLSP